MYIHTHIHTYIHTHTHTPIYIHTYIQQFTTCILKSDLCKIQIAPNLLECNYCVSQEVSVFHCHHEAQLPMCHKSVCTKRLATTQPRLLPPSQNIT